MFARKRATLFSWIKVNADASRRAWLNPAASASASDPRSARTFRRQNRVGFRGSAT
jgi:hypothetical protein